MYERFLKPILFSLDAERAHEIAIHSARSFSCFKGLLTKPIIDPKLSSSSQGLTFNNPLGLAAGMDKNALALDMWEALGFGHVEIGTVTAQPQTGNPKPRLFRFPKDEALINRMGFPSEGAEVVAERLRKWRAANPHPRCRIGINIGKTKVVPVDEARSDYEQSYKILYPYADFFVLNVSSPNTPELRKLQEPARLRELLTGIRQLNQAQKPLFIKITSDLSLPEIDEVIACAFEQSISGIIATNTTLSRQGLSVPTEEAGGLSGTPIRTRALEAIRYLSAQIGNKMALIGVGGISTVDDVVAMLRAGTCAVQFYTALVYHGPFVVQRLLRELMQYLERNNISSIEQLRGTSPHLTQVQKASI